MTTKSNVSIPFRGLVAFQHLSLWIFYDNQKQCFNPLSRISAFPTLAGKIIARCLVLNIDSPCLALSIRSVAWLPVILVGLCVICPLCCSLSCPLSCLTPPKSF